MATITATGDLREGTKSPLTETLARAFAAVRRVRAPVAALGLMALVYLALGLLIWKTERGTAEIEQGISSRAAALSRPAPDLPALRNELSGWEMALVSVESQRIDRRSDADLLADLLGAASQADVRVISSGAGNRLEQEVEGRLYLGAPVKLRAAGRLADIEKFVIGLESGTVTSHEIRSVIVSADAGAYVVDITAMRYSQITHPENEDDTDPASAAEEPAGAAVDGP